MCQAPFFYIVIDTYKKAGGEIVGKALETFTKRMRQIKEDIFVIAEAYKHPETPFYVKLFAIIVAPMPSVPLI